MLRPTAKLDFAILRKRGNLVLVGLFGGSFELSLVTIPLKSIIIQGAYTGNYDDMVELLALARKGVINPVISKRYSLDETNAALEDLQGKKNNWSCCDKSIIVFFLSQNLNHQKIRVLLSNSKNSL